MSRLIQYQLRRVGHPEGLVQLFVSEDQGWDWRPLPSAVPLGRLQWYWRRAGKKRWFKIGGVFSYV